MIPKIIHYCWFGSNIPEYVQKNVNNWKRILPNYEFKLWSESNFAVDENLYCKQAYDTKYYEFVSDYCRMKVLNEYGGIYLDTDMFLIKPFDNKLLSNETFIGAQEIKNGKLMPGFGIIGTISHTKLTNIMLDYYKTHNFINECIINKTPINEIYNTLTADIDINVKIYPVHFFYAMDIYSGHINVSVSTYAYHKWAWYDNNKNSSHWYSRKDILVKNEN